MIWEVEAEVMLATPKGNQSDRPQRTIAVLVESFLHVLTISSECHDSIPQNRK
jgi:hypothetical protein